MPKDLSNCSIINECGQNNKFYSNDKLCEKIIAAEENTKAAEGVSMGVILEAKGL